MLEGVRKAGVQVSAATQNCMIGGVVPMRTWATVNIWIASSFCHITTQEVGLGRTETTHLLSCQPRHCTLKLVEQPSELYE
jgi:hypothetical protein